MIIARWQIDARFGHKQKVIDMLRTWERDIAPKAGLDTTRGQLLTGSIGAREATVEADWTLDGLAQLERVWAELASLDEHKTWSVELEPYVVSGSARWEVFRVL